MTELVIGLGVAAGGILATVVLFFVLMRGEQSLRKSGDARVEKLEAELKTVTIDRDAALERGDVFEKNQGELLKESAALKSSLKQTEAELASVKAANDAITRTLAEHPGALPPLVRGALERLRAQVSAGTEAAAAGDPHSGEARLVHDPDALERP